MFCMDLKELTNRELYLKGGDVNLTSPDYLREQLYREVDRIIETFKDGSSREAVVHIDFCDPSLGLYDFQTYQSRGEE